MEKDQSKPMGVDTDKIVYAAMYCSNIYEGSHFCISIHESEQGAIEAMHKHKKKELWEWQQAFHDKLKFGENQDWYIEKYTLLP